jgi:hypothetical protein
MKCSDSEGLEMIEWAFLFWGSHWEESRAEIFPLYCEAQSARDNGSRAVSAEIRLKELHLQKTMPPLGRQLWTGGDLFEVVELRWGEPTALVYKNKEAYACIQDPVYEAPRMGWGPMGEPDELYVGGAIHVGAEPLDRDVVVHAYYWAT